MKLRHAVAILINQQLQQDLILDVLKKNKQALVVVMIAVEIWKACKTPLVPT